MRNCYLKCDFRANLAKIAYFLTILFLLFIFPVNSQFWKLIFNLFRHQFLTKICSFNSYYFSRKLHFSFNFSHYFYKNCIKNHKNWYKTFQKNGKNHKNFQLFKIYWFPILRIIFSKNETKNKNYFFQKWIEN